MSCRKLGQIGQSTGQSRHCDWVNYGLAEGWVGGTIYQAVLFEQFVEFRDGERIIGTLKAHQRESPLYPVIQVDGAGGRIVRCHYQQEQSVRHLYPAHDDSFTDLKKYFH